MAQIYISKGGVVLGPYEKRLIPDLLDRGVVDLDDLATPESEENWITVRDLLKGGGPTHEHEPALAPAPEIRGSRPVSGAGPKLNPDDLPKPLAHNPAGGTGASSPALNLYQTKGNSSMDEYLSKKKQPWITFLLNLVIPGSGYIYLGKPADGLVSLALIVGSAYYLLRSDWLWLIPVMAYLVCVIGSANETKRCNVEQAKNTGLHDAEEPPQYFLPLFVLIMGGLFVFLHFNSKDPDLFKDLIESFPANISSYVQPLEKYLR